MSERGIRRPEKALTARFVETVAKPGKYFDGHGLFLRVQPNGSRQRVQRITIRGKRSEIGLGSPPVVSLAKARRVALENRTMAQEGEDPIRAKREARAILTFRAAAERVHEMHKPTWTNVKHAQDFLNSLEAYAFPRLGARKVSEISSADVLAVLTPIWTDKPETARRVRQRIGTIMKWAVAQGWRIDNPAESIAKALPKQSRSKEHRKALAYAQVANCIATIKASRAWPSTKLALEFLILNASRSGEVRGARWDEIDLHGASSIATAKLASWEIPASRMKANRAHRTPLSRRALEILQEAHALRDASGLIFPSMRGKELSDMTLSKLVKELGFAVDVHGFRTSFRTWTQEKTSFPREVAEAALAHATGDSVEQAYARSDLYDRRREMMAAWADFLGEDDRVPRSAFKGADT